MHAEGTRDEISSACLTAAATGTDAGREPPWKGSAVGCFHWQTQLEAFRPCQASAAERPAAAARIGAGESGMGGGLRPAA